MDDVTMIQGITDVLLRHLTYTNILLRKYHIMLEFTLSTENEEDKEEALADIKKAIPDVQIISIEDREKLPKAVFEDEDLDGLRQLLDDLEVVVALEKKDQKKSILFKRANILFFFYEQMHNLAAVRNVRAMQALLNMEDQIYTTDASLLHTLYDEINRIVEEVRWDTEFSTWPNEKQKTYVIGDFLESCLRKFDCHSTKDVRAMVSALAADPDSADAKEFERAIGIPPSPDYINGLLDSDECQRVPYVCHYFSDIGYLATIGEGKAIQYMLNEEDNFYTLPLEELDNFMEKLEQTAGLR